MIAYLYARWSSLEQGSGSTLDRQIANCTRFATTRGWTIVEPPLIDRGRSAYTGDNIREGALGSFAGAVLSGRIEPRGAVLIVEELDRLSRQPADVMLSWLSPLVRSGLTVAVTETGRIITSSMLDSDMGGLMTLLIESFGSHTESRKKAHRVASAWQKKRDDAREGNAVQLNHRRPGWIDVEDGRFAISPASQATLDRIFARKIAGAGKSLIAKELNADRIPTFYSNGRCPAMWHPSTIGKILASRAVIGEWQPSTRPRSAKVSTPAGEAIENFYPAAINLATFAAANDLRQKVEAQRVGRGRSLSNVLSGIAFCRKCGGAVTALGSSRYRHNKDGSRSRHYFLYCSNAKVAKTCDVQRGWTYDRFEQPILDAILTLAMDNHSFAQDDAVAPLERDVATRKGEVAELERKIAMLLDLVEAGDTLAIDRYRQRQRDLGSARDTLSNAEGLLALARGRVSPAEHLRRVSEVRAMMDSDDLEERFQSRSRVKAALAGIVERIDFDAEGAIVGLKEGKRVIRVRDTGEVWNFDLHKLGSDWTSADPAVTAYVRRLEAEQS